MLESAYQARLIRYIKKLFPGCVVLKNDTDYQQGIPDLLILHNGDWAMLEVKVRENAPEQPNQHHWVQLLNDMSYAAFIYPENEEAVLNDLQLLFTPER